VRDGLADQGLGLRHVGHILGGRIYQVDA
jgi:hypothetical protein